MRLRSPAGLVALALAIAAVSSAFATGRCSPPMAPGYATSAGTAIDVVLDKATVKYLAPDITTDIAHGDCDSCLGYQSGNCPTGLSDFRIDADGYLYILDGINDKILILDGCLRFHRAIRLDGPPEIFGEVGSQIYVKMMQRDDHRLVDRLRASTTRFDPESVQPVSNQVILRAIRRTSSYLVLGKPDGPVGEVMSWNICYPGTFFTGYLMSDRFVDGTINFRINYARGLNPVYVTPILYRIDATGEVACAIDLSPAFETNYRPAISSRCGPDNTVVAVDITDTSTHIRRWNAR